MEKISTFEELLQAKYSSTFNFSPFSNWSKLACNVDYLSKSFKILPENSIKRNK